MAIQITTQSDSSQALKDLAKLNQSLDSVANTSSKTSKNINSLSGGKSSSELRKVAVQADKATDSVKQLSSNYKGLVAALASTVAVTAATLGFAKLSDSVSNLNNRLRVTADTNKGFEQSLRNVRRIALNTGTPLEGIANVYSKVSLAGKRFNVTQQQTARFTENVAKALAISGASAQEANSVIIQLGQGLGSNRLAGEELRAVLEGSQFLAIQIAEGMGIPFDRLRKEAELGRLDYQRVVNSIIKQTAKIEDTFKRINFTFSRSFKNLGSSLSILFAEVSSSLGGSGKGLPQLIKEFADKIFASIDTISFRLSRFRTQLKVLFYNIRDTLLGFAGIVIDFGVFNGLTGALNDTKNSANRFVFELKKGNVAGALESLGNATTSAGVAVKELFNNFKPENFLDTIDSLNTLTGGSKEFSFFIRAINNTENLQDMLTQLSRHEIFRAFRNPLAISFVAGVGENLGLEDLPRTLSLQLRETYAQLLRMDTTNVEDGARFVEDQFKGFLNKINIDEIRKKAPDFAKVIEGYVQVLSEGVVSGFNSVKPLLNSLSSEELLEQAKTIFGNDKAILGEVTNLIETQKVDTKVLQVLMMAYQGDLQNFNSGMFTQASYSTTESTGDFNKAFATTVSTNSQTAETGLTRIGDGVRSLTNNITNDIQNLTSSSLGFVRDKLGTILTPFSASPIVISVLGDIENGAKNAGEAVVATVEALQNFAKDNNINVNSLKDNIAEAQVYSSLLEKVAVNANLADLGDTAGRAEDFFKLVNNFLKTTTDITSLSRQDILDSFADSLIRSAPAFRKAITQYTDGIDQVRTLENFFGEDAAKRVEGVVNNLSLLGNYKNDGPNLFSSLSSNLAIEELQRFQKLWEETNDSILADRRKELGAASQIADVRISSLQTVQRLFSNLEGDSLLDKVLDVSSVPERVASVRNKIAKEFEKNGIESSIVTGGLAFQAVRDTEVVSKGFIKNVKRATGQVKDLQVTVIKDIGKVLVSSLGDAIGLTSGKLSEFNDQLNSVALFPNSLDASTKTLRKGIQNVFKEGANLAEELPDFFEDIFSSSRSEKFVKASIGVFDSIKKGVSGVFDLFGSFDIDFNPFFNFTLIDSLQIRLAELLGSVGDLFSAEMSTEWAFEGLLNSGIEAAESFKDVLDSLFNVDFDSGGFEDAIDKIGDGFQSTFREIGTSLSQIGEFGKSVGEAIASLFSTSGGSAFVQAFVSSIGLAFGYVISLFETFSFQNIITAFKDLYTGIVDGFKEGLLSALDDSLSSEWGRRLSQFFGLKNIKNSFFGANDTINGEQIDRSAILQGAGGLGDQRFNRFRPILYDQFMAIPEAFQEGLTTAILSAFGAAIVLGLSFKSVGSGVLGLFKKALAVAIAAAFIDDGVADSLTTVLGRVFGSILTLFTSFFTKMPIELGVLLAARIGLAFKPIRESFTSFLTDVAKTPVTLSKALSEGFQTRINNNNLAEITSREDDIKIGLDDAQASRKRLLSERDKLIPGLIAANASAGKAVTEQELIKATTQGTREGVKKDFERLIAINKSIETSNRQIRELNSSKSSLAGRRSAGESEQFRLNTNRENRRNAFANIAGGIGGILGLGSAIFITQMEGFGKAIENIVSLLGFSGKTLTNTTFAIKTLLLFTLPTLLSGLFTTVASLLSKILFSLLAPLLAKLVLPIGIILLKPFLILSGLIVVLAGAFAFFTASIFPGSDLYKAIAAVAAGFSTLVAIPALLISAFSLEGIVNSFKNASLEGVIQSFRDGVQFVQTQLNRLALALQRTNSRQKELFNKINSFLQPILELVKSFGLALAGTLIYFNLFGTKILFKSFDSFQKGLKNSVTSLKGFAANLKDGASDFSFKSAISAKANQAQARANARIASDAVTTANLKIFQQMDSLRNNRVTDSNRRITSAAMRGDVDVYGPQNRLAMLTLQQAIKEQVTATNSLNSSNANLTKANDRVASSDSLRRRAGATVTRGARSAGGIFGTALAIGLPLTDFFNSHLESPLAKIIVSLASFAILPTIFATVFGLLITKVGLIIVGIGLVVTALALLNSEKLLKVFKERNERFQTDELFGGTEAPAMSMLRVGASWGERLGENIEEAMNIDYTEWSAIPAVAALSIDQLFDTFATGIALLIHSVDIFVDKIRSIPQQIEALFNGFFDLFNRDEDNPQVNSSVGRRAARERLKPNLAEVAAETIPTEISGTGRTTQPRPASRFPRVYQDSGFFQNASIRTTEEQSGVLLSQEELIGSQLGMDLAIASSSIGKAADDLAAESVLLLNKSKETITDVGVMLGGVGEVFEEGSKVLVKNTTAAFNEAPSGVKREPFPEITVDTIKAFQENPDPNGVLFGFRKTINSINEDLVKLELINGRIAKETNPAEQKRLDGQNKKLQDQIEVRLIGLNATVQAETSGTPLPDTFVKTENLLNSSLDGFQKLAERVGVIIATSANTTEVLKGFAELVKEGASGFFGGKDFFKEALGFKPESITQWGEAIGRVVDSMGESFLNPVSLSLLKDFKIDGDMFDKYIERLTSLKKLDVEINAAKPGSDAKAALEKQYREELKGINEFIESATKAVNDQKLIDSGKALGKFSEVLQSMQTAFPALNVTLQDLLRIPPELREEAIKQATSYSDALKTLNDVDASQGATLRAEQIAREFQQNKIGSVFKTILIRFREDFDGLSQGLQELGLESLDKNLFRTFSEDTKRGLAASISEAITAVDAFDADQFKGASKEVALRLINSAKESIQKELTILSKITEAGTSFASSIKDEISSGLVAGLTGEQTSFTSFLKGLVDTFTRGIINTFIENFTEQLFNEGVLSGIFSSLGKGAAATGAGAGADLNELISKNPELSAFDAKLSAQVGAQTKSLTDSLAYETNKIINELRFARDPAEAIQGSMDFLQGRDIQTDFSGISIPSADLKSSEGFGVTPEAQFKGLVDLDALSLDTSVFGETPSINGKSDTVEAIKNQTAKAEQGVSFLGKNFDMNAGKVVLAIGGLGAAFAAAKNGDNFGALLSLATTAITIFGTGAKTGGMVKSYATGGYITGPGTGTSDSIPVWLSNGEYVINAAATRANKGLLDDINFGNAKKYATGGLVGNSPSVTAYVARPSEVSKTKESKQQPINITNTFQVTGDISRQTKQEILKLGGEITSIVYTNLREKRILT